MKTPYPLLPGLRWKGKLYVLGTSDDGGIRVQFDAESTAKNAGNERFIYDRGVLSPAQFRDWTGEEPPE